MTKFRWIAEWRPLVVAQDSKLTGKPTTYAISTFTCAGEPFAQDCAGD
jgi:hypothetical protein